MTSDDKVEGLQAIVILNAALSDEGREGREVPQRTGGGCMAALKHRPLRDDSLMSYWPT